MRSLRKVRGLSQERLGHFLDADRKVISRLENGVTAMTVDQAAYIARALGVPPNWLFTDSWRSLPGLGGISDDGGGVEGG